MLFFVPRWIAKVIKKVIFLDENLPLISQLKAAKPINWHGLRRLKPISRNYGSERGLPVDRYYIEFFLNKHKADIRGDVLEIGDNSYTMKYGQQKVVKSDVLHVVHGNPAATIVGNLGTGENIPKDAFDCIILTQTLQCIYDLDKAVESCYQALKQGGVILATFCGISCISRHDMDRWGFYWCLTTQSTEILFSKLFPQNKITIKAHGNVLVALSFLHGIVVKDLTKEELDYFDRDYEVLITVRAEKPRKSLNSLQ